MSEVPENLKYTSSHEWVRVEQDGTVTIGITDHAQHELGDLVFVELPEIGTHLEIEDASGVLESVKAASDLYCPIAGKVIAINTALDDTPELINQSPYDKAWLFKLEPTENSMPTLLTATQYIESITNTE